MPLRKLAGRYQPGDSFLHRLDPRTKIFSAIILGVTVFFLESLWHYLFFAGYLLLAIRAGRIGFWPLARAVQALAFLIALSATLQLFGAPGTPIWEWGFLKISDEGLRVALSLSVRLIYLGLLSALLGVTTSALQLADGLEGVLVPFARLRVPVRGLSLMFTVSLRFVPLILDEADAILKAMRARGIDPFEGSIAERARKLVALLVPLLRNTLRRAEALAEAMAARCYDPNAPRTRLYQPKFTWRDGVALLSVAGMTALVMLG
ncbi:energy-coupling factor transporter transmembrane protein EcfT [Candidatus Acetothermia bacterium]|jgi:energy-coupling factor transport system permease protein|nr:energy-coupling factor transporter transmembrane protein EcfT [Candidatus Acetothermia bacterium]MCI2430945.1 energy-coupling factor transporter transmembrane protein EcfT [Candidatus Acetothermia bacterium]MCI2437033.1 energy-coupling factor transporter transmembrane protein EcfT [Candidatus Acetothermia bacterium]